MAVGVCCTVLVLPPEIGRRGGVVEIVLLPVFEGVSSTRLSNILGNIENNDPLYTF